MKKVLLGTTALVAAGAFAGIGAAQANDMMEPVSVGVGGYYKAAVGFASGSAAKDVQSPSIAQDIEIGVSGSTTLDNGLTVGVHANIEGNVDSTSAEGSNAIDERWISFSGSFGDIQLGSIESASQQLTNFAPNAASNFGVNSPFFLFTPGFESYIATYNDGIGDEDAAKLVYFSPSFNGFRVGASFAPGDTHQGQYGGNAPGEGMVDHTSIAAEYSVDFGDANIRAMIGHEKYSMDGMCDGAAVSSMDPVMGMYRLDDKYARIVAHADAEANGGNGDGQLDSGDETDEALRVANLAGANLNDPDTADDDDNPLTNPDGTTLNAAPTGADAARQYEFIDPSKDPVANSTNCEPTALRYGLTISGGGFAVGGGILTADVANDREKTSYDVGVSYSDGAYSVALVMANASEDAIGGGEIEQERIAVNASYDLGPGISLQAQVDEGEQTKPGGSSADWTQIMFGTSINF